MVKGCVQNCAKQLPSPGFFALSEAEKGIGSSFARSCAINSMERTFKGSTRLVFQEFRAGFERVGGRRAGRGEFSARDRDLLHAVDTTEDSCRDGGDWKCESSSSIGGAVRSEVDLGQRTFVHLLMNSVEGSKGFVLLLSRMLFTIRFLRLEDSNGLS